MIVGGEVTGLPETTLFGGEFTLAPEEDTTIVVGGGVTFEPAESTVFGEVPESTPASEDSTPFFEEKVTFS